MQCTNLQQLGKGAFDLEVVRPYNDLMRRLQSLRKVIRRSPLVAIEFILAVFTLLGGLYVLSPLLEISIKLTGGSPVMQAIASETGILILGVATVLSALLILYGIFRGSRRLRGAGLFINGLIRMYVVLATWLMSGLIPLSWLSNATLMVIAIYLWWRTKDKT